MIFLVFLFSFRDVSSASEILKKCQCVCVVSKPYNTKNPYGDVAGTVILTTTVK